MSATTGIQSLEERKLEINVNGIKRLMPALHAGNLVTREWVSFASPPKSFEELTVSGAKETWIEKASLVADDLSDLLGRVHSRFEF